MYFHKAREQRPLTFLLSSIVSLPEKSYTTCRLYRHNVTSASSHTAVHDVGTQDGLCKYATT